MFQVGAHGGPEPSSPPWTTAKRRLGSIPLRLPYALAPALIILLTVPSLAAASPATVGTTAHVTNAPPAVEDAGLTPHANGSITAWAVVSDANGARDLETVTFATEPANQVPGVRVSHEGTDARYEATLSLDALDAIGEGASVHAVDRTGARTTALLGSLEAPAGTAGALPGASTVNVDAITPLLVLASGLTAAALLRRRS